jgi:CheY-like chemotaxis protein
VEHSPKLTELKIVVVEDEPDLRYFLTIILQHHEANVRAFESPDQALDALLAGYAPDLLVSDIGLPGAMDGYEFIREVRRRESETGAGRLKALAVTAFGQPADRQQALDSGFDEHVVKPFDPAQLVRVLAALVAAPTEPGSTGSPGPS